MKRFKLSLTQNPVFQTVTGLTNKTWNGTPTTGRAATEDQLAALAGSIQVDTNTITTVQGSANVTVTDAGTGGNHAYTISVGDAEEYKVISIDNNIIVTEDDGTDPPSP